MPQRFSSRPVAAASRRDFIATASVVAGGYWIAPDLRAEEAKPATSANEEIRFACIGIGGKGQSDSADASRSGRVVAVADVDANQLKRGEKAFEGAKQFADFRRLFDECAQEFDAVTVSTPDHTHVTAAALAMNLGKHCFCQKPLTRSIAEARLLADLAASRKVATQMGNQGTAGAALRETSAVVASGALGRVRELHVWTNRPVWAQGGGRPAEAAVPAHLDWDAWLGPAPLRPYAAGYHPFAWRGFWDFGSGALGDMACHTFNMPFMALNLRDPASVQAVTSGHNGETFPKWSVIDFEFPELSGRPAVTVKWYDGGKLPDAGLFAGFKGEMRKVTDEAGNEAEKEQPFRTAASGVLVIGDADALYAPGDYCEKGAFLKSGKALPKVDVEKSPGHFAEFVNAIKGGPPAVSNFPGYAGPLTETILLGNLAVWAAATPDVPGKKIEWDSATLVAKNAPEVEQVIRPRARAGWNA
ncbi:MAG: Gfo/Idh/MocA family oxidoreductase [Planctomycetia bacterium]